VPALLSVDHEMEVDLSWVPCWYHVRPSTVNGDIVICVLFVDLCGYNNMVVWRKHNVATITRHQHSEKKMNIDTIEY